MQMRSYLHPLHTFHVPFREAMSSLWGSEVVACFARRNSWLSLSCTVRTLMSLVKTSSLLTLDLTGSVVPAVTSDMSMCLLGRRRVYLLKGGS